LAEEGALGVIPRRFSVARNASFVTTTSRFARFQRNPAMNAGIEPKQTVRKVSANGYFSNDAPNLNDTKRKSPTDARMDPMKPYTEATCPLLSGNCSTTRYFLEEYT
jgi:hypothetical protein